MKPRRYIRAFYELSIILGDIFLHAVFKRGKKLFEFFKSFFPKGDNMVYTWRSAGAGREIDSGTEDTCTYPKEKDAEKLRKVGEWIRVARDQIWNAKNEKINLHLKKHQLETAERAIKSAEDILK